MEDQPLTNAERARKCAVCVVCCPCNCAVSCAEELRDTAIYFALCPQRCVEERRKQAKIRKTKGTTILGEYKDGCIKAVTPDENCCGETPAHRCVCCFVSPLNWGKYIHLYFIHYTITN